MLESTRGQTPETLRTMDEPVLNLSCVTVRHTKSLMASISNVTRDYLGSQEAACRPVRCRTYDA